jgi:hypothetical protein
MSTISEPLDLDALARAAVTYTLPLYEITRMLAASSVRRNLEGQVADPDPHAGPESSWRWVNLFGHTRRLLGPADRRVVTPNNDTLYTNAWLDLSDGPLLIHTPDTGSRYYVLGFLDFWTNPFFHAGTRVTGNRANTLFVHGPRWQGTVPEGIVAIAAPTAHVWVLGRVLADAHEDLTAVHALQDCFTVCHADLSDTPCAGKAVRVPLLPQDLPRDGATFVRVVNTMLLSDPPPTDQAALLASFASVGIGPGLPLPADLARIERAIAEVLADLDSTKHGGDRQGGWSLPIRLGSSFGDDWPLRAWVARGYIGGLANDEAMYVMAEVDADGAVLDGRKRYQLRFSPEAMPQVGAFWSLTMYRKSDYLLVDNPIQRYSIGDRTPGLRRDADGGLTIYIASQPPMGARSNWLPAPEGVFYLALRLYLPGQQHLERRYTYPPIRCLAKG